jgi:hypothetical protein
LDVIFNREEIALAAEGDRDGDPDWRVIPKVAIAPSYRRKAPIGRSAIPGVTHDGELGRKT